MSYVCDSCEFHTDKLYNYQRHMESSRHIKIVQGVKSNYCDTCHIQFAHRSGFTRHNNNFHDKNMTKNIVTSNDIKLSQQLNATHYDAPKKLIVQIKQNPTVKPFLTKEQFIDLFPTVPKTTSQRRYYELRKYFPDNQLPSNWKNIFMSNMDNLDQYVSKLDPCSGKRFIQSLFTTIPELRSKLAPKWDLACKGEKEYLLDKEKPTQVQKKDQTYINKLFDIVGEVYKYPFRFQEIYTAKVKRDGNTIPTGMNYYDMDKGIFHIMDDKVKKYYAEMDIKFNDKLIKLLLDWLTNDNLTDNFLLSVRGEKLTTSSFRYILDQLEITPTRGRKIYANEHKDDVDSYKKMRHTLLTHQISYINSK